jgi:hypothetical protein
LRKKADRLTEVDSQLAAGDGSPTEQAALRTEQAELQKSLQMGVSLGPALSAVIATYQHLDPDDLVAKNGDTPVSSSSPFLTRLTHSQKQKVHALVPKQSYKQVDQAHQNFHKQQGTRYRQRIATELGVAERVKSRPTPQRVQPAEANSARKRRKVRR